MAVPLKPTSNLTDECQRWLNQAGLSHLIELFAEESIDIDVLPDLTEHDLAEIGVRLGDRRRFLKAQEASFGNRSAIKDEPPSETVPAEEGGREASAERRYLTVMFCDLVGSTQLTASLDPEEVRRILREYRDGIAAEVNRFEGHIAQYLGDGVLAYFGWPRALEQSPARAVTAGLSIIKAVASIKSPLAQPLAVRIGIATGLVVVGDFLSGSESEERTAIGDVVNIAARLQNVAKPGSVVIAEATLKLLGDGFKTQAAGTFDLKGLPHPVDVFEVTGFGDTSTRYAKPLKNMSSGEIVGREDELMLAKRRWRQTLEGSGQVIAVTGEPGIGKSRFTAEIVREISDESCLVLHFFSSPFHVSTALHPFIEHFSHAAHMKLEDTPAERLQKLEALVSAAGADMPSTIPYIAHMMAVPYEDKYGTEDLTPMIRKARTFSALVRLLEAQARKKPVLVILEDAHWLDPTSLEMFELMMQTITNIPVMLLVNYRPEFRPPWSDAGNLTLLSLQKLRQDQVAAIVGRISGGRPLPAQIINMIFERAGGNPLYVEELTRTVLESGVLKEINGRLDIASPQSEVIIPNTLRDSLSARLDRHPEARDIARVAACIGRDFEFWLLREVTNKATDQLVRALEKLQKGEIISCRGIPPEATYTFRHGLVKDAAADGLLRSRRKQIHERIARIIEDKVPDFTAKHHVILAHHFTEAQCFKEACNYRQKAGNAALAASGNLEAIGEFNTALELIKLVPESPERDSQEIDILVAQAIAYTLTLGYAAPEVEAVYKRALETCARLDDGAKSFAIVYGFWRFYLLRADYSQAQVLSSELMRLAALNSDEASAVTANRAVGSTKFYTADFSTALKHLERTAGIHPHPELRRTVLGYDVVDPWVVNHAYAGMALWICGDSEKAKAQNELAIKLARRIDHPFTLSLALCFAQWTYQFEGDRQKVRELAQEALELSRRHNFAFWTGWAEVLHAWSEHNDDRSATRERMKQGLQLWQSTGSLLGLSYFQTLLAEVSEGIEAQLLFDAAQNFSEEHDERFWLPEIHRMRGQFQLKAGHDRTAGQAEACFTRALDTARLRDAKALELRAACDLAKLWAARGEGQRATDLLKNVSAKFPSETKNAALRHAEALLTSLRKS